MNRTEAVADYIRRGWVPFAYEHLFTPGLGWQQSRVTEHTIKEVSTSENPVALLLGQPSELVVVDVDPRNGGNAGEVARFYGIKTRTVRTASGGYHFYFKHKGPLRKTKGEKVHPVLKGVDLLADGSHVVAPPTVRIGHPDKVDGDYTLIRDIEITELPLSLLLDWETATARTHPTTGEVLDEIPEELYDKVLGIHKRNVELAASAPEGSRDDECIARMGASMRIAVALPDSVLSAEKVREDYRTGVPYEIKDLDGKIDRAIEWARNKAWTEEVAPAGFTLPDTVPPEKATEFWDALNNLRVREAAKAQFQVEIREAEARKTPMGQFLGGADFLARRPDTPKWLVEGLVHHGGSVMLAGKYKSGKSTLMLNLIQAMTSGGRFLGSNVLTPLRVAYADMELGISLAFDWMNDLPGLVPENLLYMPRVGQGATLNVRSEHIRAKLARALRGEAIDVLIVDPLSPVMSALGVSEKDAETVRPMLDSFDMLKVEANLKAIVLTHHTGHQEAGRTRGSTAFMDWCSSFMSVIRQGEDADSPRIFRAYGRDVNVPTTQLMFDEKTRELRLAASVFAPAHNTEADNPF